MAGQRVPQGAGGGVALNTLHAPEFPEPEVRSRALRGTAAAFPSVAGYGVSLYGAGAAPTDRLDAARLVPPVFVPSRLDKLVDLAREPTYQDVALETRVGGFLSTLPLYVSAFGSTNASSGLGVAAARQAGRLGIPLVIGENVTPVNGYGRVDELENTLLPRVKAYLACAPDLRGGLVIQQSTSDADCEVWNLVYSDPNTRPLLESGRLGFELKVGQGAKPGLGGMTVASREDAPRLASAFTVDPVLGPHALLRSTTPGTFTEEILRRQIQLMRNNYPRAKVWVKLPPARDIRAAALVAWSSGADAVTVDGAEAGTGWAPSAFLDHVGLPLGECLHRIGPHPSCLLASGRMWEGTRAAKCLALGATAVGLGRAALLAVDTDPDEGLLNLVHCLALELRMLTSALGKYHTSELSTADIWSP